jgi:hypothetical protein
MGRPSPEVRTVRRGDVVLVWGDAAEAKAALRAESRARHANRPPADRLLAALELVRRDARGRSRT